MNLVADPEIKSFTTTSLLLAMSLATQIVFVHDRESHLETGLTSSQANLDIC